MHVDCNNPSMLGRWCQSKNNMLSCVKLHYIWLSENAKRKVGTSRRHYSTRFCRCEWKYMKVHVCEMVVYKYILQAYSLLCNLRTCWHLHQSFRKRVWSVNSACEFDVSKSNDGFVPSFLICGSPDWHLTVTTWVSVWSNMHPMQAISYCWGGSLSSQHIIL